MRSANVVRLLAVVIVAAARGASTPQTPALSPEAVQPNGTGASRVQFVLNFEESPVRAVFDYLSQRAGLTIVSDTPLDGSITVINGQPLDLDHAIALVNSVLRQKNLVALRIGKTLKVLTLSKAKTVGGLPVTSDGDLDGVEGGDDVVTHVVSVRFLDAVALRQNLISLLPETATIQANRDANALIVTDTTANIKRLMKIVRALDSELPAVSQIRVFHLTRAQASSVAQIINIVFRQDQQGISRGQQGSPAGQDLQGRGRSSRNQQIDAEQTTADSLRIVAAADERSNSVVVRGLSEVLEIVAHTVARLDSPATGVADVRVFHLRYAGALNVAQLINQLFGQIQTAGRSQQVTPTFIRQGAALPPADQQQDARPDSFQVVAAADSRTNSVVVTGPDGVLDVVADTLKKLDAQVPNVADVVTFHLDYAGAADTSAIINRVFGAGQTAQSSGSRSTQQDQAVSYRAPDGAQ